MASQNKLIDQNDKLIEQNKKLVAALEEYQHQFFEKLHQSLYDFFEGSPIDHYIIKMDKEGDITIQIGQDDDMVQVDMDVFRENPPAALEQAKFAWMQKDND